MPSISFRNAPLPDFVRSVEGFIVSATDAPANALKSLPALRSCRIGLLRSMNRTALPTGERYCTHPSPGRYIRHPTSRREKRMPRQGVSLSRPQPRSDTDRKSVV